MILDMSDIGSPQLLNGVVSEEMKNEKKDFELDTAVQHRTYPNVCVPVAGVIDFYRVKGAKFSVIYENQNDYIKRTAFENPLSVEKNSYLLSQPLDKVWVFSSSEDINEITDAFIRAIRGKAEIEKGIISGIEWCVNETMDNVLVHSGSAPHGFIMGQLQKENNKLALSIFDCGMGIYNSLKNSKHKPSTQIEAIKIALQEKATRDEKIGQGNGLWGLRRIIEDNGGLMRVSSCGAEILLKESGEESQIQNGCLRFSDELGSTLIDFQLDYSKPIDIAKALNGHSPIDMWIDNKTLDDDSILFDVSKDSQGTGTRQAAIKFRNTLLNTIRETSQKIILDFSGVELVSSSYADELIGKIISEHGFMFFVTRIMLKNVSHVNLAIINRSVEMRMAQKHS